MHKNTKYACIFNKYAQNFTKYAQNGAFTNGTPYLCRFFYLIQIKFTFASLPSKYKVVAFSEQCYNCFCNSYFCKKITCYQRVLRLSYIDVLLSTVSILNDGARTDRH